MANGGYDGPERRQEAQEWAMWRGRIDARVVALEVAVGSLERSHAAITKQQVRMEEQQIRMEEALGSMREEVAQAAKTIEKGREQSVVELKESIKEAGVAKVQERDARIARWLQVTLAFIAVIIAPMVSALITLAIAGKI